MLTMLMIESPLGPLRLVADGDELVALHLPHLGGSAPLRPPELAIDAREARTRVLAATARQLSEYFAGTRRTFELPLAPRGSGFQERVWRALLAIPFGETKSYGEIARAIASRDSLPASSAAEARRGSIGRPSASRAVGAANGKNPIAIIVPCHRVIGADGTLTGYGGGLPAKRWLLEHERKQGDLFARAG